MKMNKAVFFFAALTLTGCLESGGRAIEIDPGLCATCGAIEAFWENSLAESGILEAPIQTDKEISVQIEVIGPKGQPLKNSQVILVDGRTGDNIDARYTDREGKTTFTINKTQPLPIVAIAQGNLEYELEAKPLESTKVKFKLERSGFDPETALPASGFQGALLPGAWMTLPNKYALRFNQFTYSENKTGFNARIYDDEGILLTADILLKPYSRFFSHDFVLYAIDEVSGPNGGKKLNINVTWSQKVPNAQTVCALYGRKNGEQEYAQLETHSAKEAIRSATACFKWFKARLFNQAGCGTPKNRDALVILAENPPKTMKGQFDAGAENLVFWGYCYSNTKTNP